MPRYVLERCVGTGGMAEVFLARAEGAGGFSRRVAVKRLLARSERDLEIRTRFIDEARIAATLDHPNIVKVFDFEEVDGRHQLAMEFVDGASLEELRVRSLAGRFLSARVVAFIGHEVARALVHAHARDVVHRDVSPCNVLVSKSGEVKLADFGLAKAAEKLWSTEPGAVSGKLNYLSPERKRGAEGSPTDDLWALGMTLKFLLEAGDPRHPNEAARAPLQGIVHRLLAPAPVDRLATASRLVEELRVLPLADADTLADLFRESPAPAARRPLAASDLDDTTDDGAAARPDDDEATQVEPAPRGAR